MKRDNTQAVVLMTTKKGTEKGTRKVYMVMLKDMSIISETDNVRGIIYDKEFPVGVSGMIKGGIMVMNQSRVIIDPLHSVKELSHDDLSAIQMSDYVDLASLAGVEIGETKESVNTQEVSQEEIRSFVDKMFDEAFGGRSIKEVQVSTTKETPEDVAASIQKAFKDMGVDAEVRHVASMEEVKQEPKKAAKQDAKSTQSATEKMDEISALFKSGKMTHEKFREVFPEGSMLEFSKQLSQETGDPSFYSLAKVLEALRPSK